MAGYIGSRAAVATSGVERKKTFAITTTTTSLTGLDYTPNHVHVFHNGIRLVDGTDYTATNGTSITLVNAAENGDEVVVVSYGTFSPADTYTKTEADDRYVNASGDTMTGALNGRSFITADDTNNYALMAGRYSAGYGGAVINTTSNASFLELQVNGFGGLRADSAGRVTMPYQPSFTGAFTGTYNGTTLVFNSVGHNDGGIYNTSTGRFTAPVAGKYLYQAIVLKSTGSSSALDVIINGTRNHNLGQERSYSTTSGYDHLIINCVYKLQANDWIDLNYIGSINYNTAATDQYNCMSINLIG